MSQTTWRSGVSATSAGRFNGWRDLVFEEVPFLCWLADDKQVRLDTQNTGVGIVVFRWMAPMPHRLEKSVNWVCRTYRYSDDAGRTIATMYQSLLSPGLLIDLAYSTFQWENTELFNGSVAYAGPEGVVRIHNPEECGPVELSFTGKDDITEPWLLQWSTTGANTALLFVFERKPRSIYTITRGQDISFAGPAGKVAVMPLWGVEPVDSGMRGGLRRGLSPQVLERCRRWARILMAYPTACDETFAIDDEKQTATIRNRYTYVTFSPQWPTQPLTVAPIPPVLNMARLNGYPIEFSTAPMDLKLPVRCGYLDAVEGSELIYTIPCHGCHEAVAPVRVINSAQADSLLPTLRKEIAQPTLTFGGDNTYDPDNIQDILHNLRVLGWACWSLPAPERRAGFDGLARDLHSFVLESYQQETEPNRKGRYLVEKHIWTGSNTTVDFEWYNGMQLAGLWAAAYFGEHPRYLQMIRQRWDLVRGVFDYFSVWNDWATMATWTSMTKLFLWMDGLHFALQGFQGLARLARMAGDDELRRLAEYHTAKSLVTRYACLFSHDYAQTLRLLPERAAGPGAAAAARQPDAAEATFYICNGYEARIGAGTSTTAMRGVRAFNASNLVGYCTPELLLFYWEYPRCRQRIREYEYEVFPREVPNWTRYYAKNAAGEGPDQRYPLYASHMHFYQLDMHLMMRSLMFREDLKTLLGYVGEHSGPVIEHYLVGSRPVALIPTWMLLRDHVWDEATSQLTLVLGRDEQIADVPTAPMLRLWTRTAPTAIDGAERFEFDAANEMCRVWFRLADQVTIRATFRR